jgi:hypothetical protein
MLFGEGKIEESVTATYDIEGAKEDKYKRNGIKVALDYYQKRFP